MNHSKIRCSRTCRYPIHPQIRVPEISFIRMIYLSKDFYRSSELNESISDIGFGYSDRDRSKIRVQKNRPYRGHPVIWLRDINVVRIIQLIENSDSMYVWLLKSMPPLTFCRRSASRDAQWCVDVCNKDRCVCHSTSLSIKLDVFSSEPLNNTLDEFRQELLTTDDLTPRNISRTECRPPPDPPLSQPSAFLAER